MLYQIVYIDTNSPHLNYVLRLTKIIIQNTKKLIRNAYVLQHTNHLFVSSL